KGKNHQTHCPDVSKRMQKQINLRVELLGTEAIDVTWPCDHPINRHEIEQAHDRHRRVNQSKPRSQQRGSTVYRRKQNKESQRCDDVADEVNQISKNCGEEEPVMRTNISDGLFDLSGNN